MNKTAIKNFAVSARRKLIAMAADKAGRIGITATTIAEPSSSGSQFAIFPTGFGTQTRLDGDAVGQRASLVSHVKSDGYDTVMEEVAYTWFNRMIAVRFMEVNDYLPTRVRVLSSETPGKFEPDLVTQAPNVDLGFSEAEKEEIYALKDDPEKSGDLFRTLFIRQCNALGAILPELFEKTADYTELLLDLSWDKPDGVIRDLLSIDEADFREAVEIVGWLYQYYNTEPKDETFALLKKNVKITKERIPSATQLFTPDWIVRYMVENSLGRFWLEGHPDDGLKSDWKYYLDEAEQEPAVLTQLAQIRSEYKTVRPEDIKIIDPCMGSGHILVYAFDVLMQIYLSCGYTKEDAAALIVKKNLYGLDIDKRAFQLTYF
ncbi:MAG: restriction endonuclease, partial [Oscillospiraceae bacterium]